jgi:TM2 domain-containing membrane protein YozV
VLDDLYKYPRKRQLLARALWLFTGFLGGHRFYLERTGTGILMLLTGGGAGIWWFVDFFLLRGMVRAFNTEQENRQLTGLPPVALDFMPPTWRAETTHPPTWATKRSGRARLAGDVAVLLVAGSALGAVSASTGNFEGIVAILAIIAITNLGARWHGLAHLPLLRGLDLWSHRLRLYYHSNDPGGPISLLLRPVVGLWAAAFRKRARAEVRLYLELGAVFAILFTLADLGEVVVISGGDFNISFGGLAGDMVQTFVSIYAFAAPIGAVLTTHLLLEKTDRLLWVLSGLSIVALALGFFSG